MNLYKLTQTENEGLGTYDACIVVAESPEDAVLIHPDSGEYDYESDSDSGWGSPWSRWASTPKNVTVKYVGTAAAGLMPGLLLASFNE
jgi:hypothetical protein